MLTVPSCLPDISCHAAAKDLSIEQKTHATQTHHGATFVSVCRQGGCWSNALPHHCLNQELN